MDLGDLQQIVHMYTTYLTRQLLSSAHCLSVGITKAWVVNLIWILNGFTFISTHQEAPHPLAAADWQC